VVDDKVQVQALLDVASDSPEAEDTVLRLRSAVDDIGEDVLVGGGTAVVYDIKQESARDSRVIIPAILVVIFLVLAVLLRAIVAPLLLVGTVVLSFFATLGVCALVFDNVFGFAGADPSFPLFAFVFLVALGIDYNIFLMTAVREESLVHGTRAGTLKGLAVTGGVITSAGVVLAATFAALGVLPLVPFAELGFACRVRRAARHPHRPLAARARPGARAGRQGVVADRPAPVGGRGSHRRASARRQPELLSRATGPVAQAGRWRGSRTRNVVPAAPVSTSTVPECRRSTIRRTLSSPSPLPVTGRLGGEEGRPRCAAGRRAGCRGPSSTTSTTASSPSRRVRSTSLPAPAHGRRRVVDEVGPHLVQLGRAGRHGRAARGRTP
jgi:hypothetical protein